MNLLVGLMLTACAVEDWYTKKISVFWPAAGFFTALVIRLWEDSFLCWEYWMGAVIGILFFMLAIVSREQIGKGDGLVVAVYGFCLGWKKTLSLVLGTMIIFLAVGVVSVLCQRKSRKTAMAYVPFLWGMFMISLII